MARTRRHMLGGAGSAAVGGRPVGGLQTAPVAALICPAADSVFPPRYRGLASGARSYFAPVDAPAVARRASLEPNTRF